jgi:hypothetical protein
MMVWQEALDVNTQARLVMLLGVLWGAPADGAMAGQPGNLDVHFEPIPGVREPSGRLIVRPTSVEHHLKRGLPPHQAEQRARRAEQRLQAHLVKQFSDVGELIVTPPAAQSEKQYAAALLATGDYDYVEPDWLVAPAGMEPNDLYYIDQWYLPHIRADWAWFYTQGNVDVVVAIVDTGVDVAHPDLAGSFVPGFNVVDELAEIDGGMVSDVYGHGTRVAGIIAASGNNSIGVCGVGWDFSLMPIRATNALDGLAFVSDLNHGARWAAEHGARIVNVSYHGVGSSSVQTTGEYIRGLGGLVIWSIGNGSEEIVDFDHPDVIVVASTDAFDSFATFSNFGAITDLVAPGTPIRTTLNGGGYVYVGGTSYSAPIVTGVAALMWSAAPSRTSLEIEHALLSTASDLGEPGDDALFGHGIVDAFEAVKMARRCPADMVSTNTTQPPPDGVVDGADLAYLLGSWGSHSPSLADIASITAFALPGDGAIDGVDLAVLLGAWGACTP